MNRLSPLQNMGRPGPAIARPSPSARGERLERRVAGADAGRRVLYQVAFLRFVTPGEGCARENRPPGRAGRPGVEARVQGRLFA